VQEIPSLAMTAIEKMIELLKSSATGDLSLDVINLAESCLVENAVDPDLMDFLHLVGNGLLTCAYADDTSVHVVSSQEATLATFNTLLCNNSFRSNAFVAFTRNNQITVDEGVFNMFFFKI
jgi:hypothetical protein